MWLTRKECGQTEMYQNVAERGKQQGETGDHDSLCKLWTVVTTSTSSRRHLDWTRWASPVKTIMSRSAEMNKHIFMNVAAAFQRGWIPRM